MADKCRRCEGTDFEGWAEDRITRCRTCGEPNIAVVVLMRHDQPFEIVLSRTVSGAVRTAKAWAKRRGATVGKGDDNTYVAWSGVGVVVNGWEANVDPKPRPPRA
jgi:hypothetical protein